VNLEESRNRERERYRANPAKRLKTNSRWRLANQDAVKAGKRHHYETVKHTPKFQQRMRAITMANKDAKREYDRQYRKRDPERMKERSRAWSKANPDKRRAIIHNYAARRRAWTDGNLTVTALIKWKAAQPKACYWCGVRCARAYHVDHYIPLSRGGLHEISNLVIACPRCNLTKNAKDPLEFAREVGRLF
jgi:5-methylcytosine-specific restriction endonuclease McrA